MLLNRREVLLTGAIFASGALSAAAEAAQERPQKLIAGLLPGESPDVVKRLNEPLRAYLENRLHLPVELEVGANYRATSEALRYGTLDIAFLGPITYLLRSRSAHLEAFARPYHEGVGPYFNACIIVPAGSSAKTLADLKGGSVAFGDSMSTSGTWVPRHQLLEAGLVAGRDYTPRCMGGHGNVLRAVADALVSAGGLSLPVYNRLLKEGKVSAAAVRILAESPPIPEYMWTFREGLGAGFKEEIRKAFLSVTDSSMLKVFRATSFVDCCEPDLDQVRKWMAATEEAVPGTIPKTH